MGRYSKSIASVHTHFYCYSVFKNTTALKVRIGIECIHYIILYCHTHPVCTQLLSLMHRGKLGSHYNLRNVDLVMVNPKVKTLYFSWSLWYRSS